MRSALRCCRDDNAVVDRGDRGAATTGGTDEAAALAETVYYDTRQSLSESILYPPATVAAPSTGRKFCLDEPQELLFSSNKRPTSVRDSVMVKRLLLQKQGTVQQRGYPGELTEKELEACLEFRKELQQKKDQEPSYHEMVYCYEGVEEEPLALCRTLRARNFVVQDAFKMMDGNLDLWKEAKQHDFYPDLEAAAGCPLSVLWTQFPFLYYGVAKNGSIVAYFQPGRIQLEAVECLTDLEMLEAFIWHDCLYMFKEAVANAKTGNKDTAVRCENTCIIDLKGLSRSLLNDRVMKVMKECCNGLQCFPEVLNKMVIVNAPSFFSVSWLVIKQFVDPRTVAKIGIYSNEQKGNKYLSELIDKKQLLSEYGGHGPSFDEVLQQQRADGSSRQFVERLSIAPRGDAKCHFALTSTEKAAAVVVYTRSAEGAHFSISKGQNTLNKLDVKSEKGDSQPYSREIATNVEGPAKFNIFAKSNNTSATEHFLVVTRVYDMNK